MNRRGLLSLFGGGAAAVVSGVSVKDAAAQLGLENGLVVGGPLPNVVSEGGEPSSNPYSGLPHSYMRHLWRMRDRIQHSNPHMPAHIATKRSWSPAFKEGVNRREVEIMEAFINKVEADEAFAERVGKMLGLN
jgi:hypothetical protein